MVTAAASHHLGIQAVLVIDAGNDRLGFTASDQDIERILQQTDLRSCLASPIATVRFVEVPGSPDAAGCWV